MQRASINHIKFLSILMAFFLPLLIAHLVYASGFKGNTSNKGQWADTNLKVSSLHTIDHQPVSLPHRWHVVAWQNTAFDDAFHKHMTQIDHLHTLLRRDMDKVDIMIFTTTQLPTTTLKTRQLERFPAELSEGNWRSIIDPDGRIILHYPASQAIEDTLKDLKQALKFRRDV